MTTCYYDREASEVLAGVYGCLRRMIENWENKNWTIKIALHNALLLLFLEKSRKSGSNQKAIKIHILPLIKLKIDK